MKKFFLCITLLINLQLSVSIYPQNCLKLVYPHNPSIGLYNPDSVMVDTCSSKEYARSLFTVVFKTDPFQISLNDRDTIVIRNYNDLDSNNIGLKNLLIQVDSIYSNFVLVKRYPDISDTTAIASRVYYLVFENYVDIDNFREFMLSSNYIEECFLSSRPYKACGFPNEKSNVFGEIKVNNQLFGMDDQNWVPKLFDDNANQYYYNKLSLNWHIYSICLPLSWEITKGSNNIKIGIIDHFGMDDMFDDNNIILKGQPLKRNKLNNNYFEHYPHRLLNSTGDLFYYTIPNNNFTYSGNTGAQGNIFLPVEQVNNINTSIIGDGYVPMGQISSIDNPNHGNTDHGIQILSIISSKHNVKGISGVAPNCLSLLLDPVYSNELHQLDVDGIKDNNPTFADIITYSSQSAADIDNSNIIKAIDQGTIFMSLDNGIGRNDIGSIIEKSSRLDYKILQTSMYDPGTTHISQVTSAVSWDPRIDLSKAVSTYQTYNYFNNDYEFSPLPENITNFTKWEADSRFIDGNELQKIGLNLQVNDIITQRSRLKLGNFGPDILSPSNVLSCKADEGTYGVVFGLSSYSIPLVTGTIGLMKSVSKYFDLPLINGKPQDMMNVIRRVNEIILVTAKKLRVDITEYNQEYENIKYKRQVLSVRQKIVTSQTPNPNPNDPIRFFTDYDDLPNITILADYLDRWYSPYLGFGKLNAFRCVMHSIPVKAPYENSSSYNLNNVYKFTVNSNYPITFKPNLGDIYKQDGNNNHQVKVINTSLEKNSNGKYIGVITGLLISGSICTSCTTLTHTESTQTGDATINISTITNCHPLESNPSETKYFIHFGSKIKEGEWVRELFNLDGNGKPNPYTSQNSWSYHDPYKSTNINGVQPTNEELNVLEWGGRHFPGNTTEPWKNNWGETILKNSSQITIPDNFVACIDGIVRQPNEQYEIANQAYEPTVNCKFVTSGSGKILITGYLRDVELNGLIKTDDLEVNSSTSAGYGKLLFKSITGENSEIYGIVNVNNDSKMEMTATTSNKLIIQPGGEIHLKGTQGITITPNSTLELAYGAEIIKEVGASESVAITIEDGGTLKIQKGAAVTIDVPIIVKPGGNLIFEDNTLAWIDNIIVEENDGINHGVIFNTNNTKLGSWILPATGKTGIITIQSGATVYIPQVDKTIHPKVTEIKIDSPVEILDGGSLTVSNEARLSVDKIILNETGSLNLMNGAVILPAEGKTGKVQIMPNALLTINGVSNSDKKNISILGGVDVFGTVEQTPNGFTLKKGEFNIKWVNLNIGPISSTSFTLIKIDESSVKLFAANSYNNNPKRQSIGFVKATIFGDFEILNSEFNTSKGSSSLIPNSTEDDFVVSQFSIINSGYPSIFPSEPRVNFTYSNFKNICFKVWDSHLEPIQNCTFIYNSADLKSNLDKDEFSGFSANSLLEKTITPWFPSSLGSSMLDLSLTNCTFKDEAAVNNSWLTDRTLIPTEPNNPNASIEDYSFHLIGVFAQNLRKISINNSTLSIPPELDQNHFKGLNYGIKTENCAIVDVRNTKHSQSRIGISDARGSVFLCQNTTNQTQIPFEFNDSKNFSKAYDNEVTQSLYGIRLDITKEQITRGTSFLNYLNAIYVAKGESVLNGEKNPNIPGERYIEGRNKFTVTLPNNNIFNPEFTTQNDPQSDVVLLNQGITNNQYRSFVRLYCGDNELALLSYRNIFNEIDNGTDNLEVNGERNNFQASTKVENIYLTGTILDQPFNPDVPGCDDPPLQSVQDFCPSEPSVCTYFRNNINWYTLQSDSTVIDAEFYSALYDLCDGQLSCDCYELKVRDLIQWASLDANPDSTRDKLMLIRACLQEKRNDSLSAFFSCAGDLILMSLGEIEERMGNYQGAKKHYQDIHYFFPMTIDTMYAQWRYLYCDAMTIDTTFGAKYDSAMAVYLHRVAADISSKDTSTTPPGGQYKIGLDKELDEAPAFPPDPDYGEIESIAPNPLTNETVIRYRLKKECDIELIVYDWLGQETKTLVKGRYKKGNYVVTFLNEGYANSSYMCALRFNGAPGQVKIMLIVK